jgi:hypothetical protein
MLTGEREVLQDAIGIGRMNDFCGAEAAAALGAFACQQVAFAGAGAQNFTASGYFEPFRYRFLRLNAFGASHKNFLLPQSGLSKERGI